ncbi:signal peptide-containing protein [Theileria equi strain WA]|uniref:Signal peptide-containing protein n=1 Tax=Theileria equi strain WA TaxID=1537102 RepID=L0AWU6_THEEQ|nr:signal peptide-containing protein [Theileria equi strain WA]AFZ79728.1 signal peptide-containing protein [Theileria equi strain WA]|eukprot:XP_004829394.1 signal peptide-containing protein [Theileria equi strain WA]
MNVLWDLCLILWIGSSIATITTSGRRMCTTVRANNRARQNIQTSDRGVPNAPTTVPSGLVLDLEKPDDKLYQSFDYDTDGIPTRFIVPKDDNVITSVKEGSLEVWKASGDNVACAFVTLRLSDGKPVIAQLTKNTNGNPMVIFVKKDGTWKVTDDYKGELNKLRRTTESVENFTLDLSANQDTPNCRIFDTKLYGVPVRFYAPKFGFHATKMSFGGTELWTNAPESNKRIFLLIAGLGNGELKTINAFIRDPNNGSELLYYGFKDGKWENISKDEYNKKFEGLKK